MTERILQTADRLFYQRGIRAVGVDMVAAEAGISKRSLYDYFPSKDALIEAYLERRIAAPPASGEPPATRILAVFERLEQLFASGDFRGCPFVNAVAELGDSCRAVQNIAARYKLGRRAWLRDILLAAGAAEAETLATQISLLIEGAIAAMLIHGDPAVARSAGAAAEVLMQAAGI
jgi:AcrR family transcriptional regulator